MCVCVCLRTYLAFKDCRRFQTYSLLIDTLQWSHYLTTQVIHTVHMHSSRTHYIYQLLHNKNYLTVFVIVQFSIFEPEVAILPPLSNRVYTFCHEFALFTVFTNDYTYTVRITHTAQEDYNVQQTHIVTVKHVHTPPCYLIPSSLTIPPWSETLSTKVGQNYYAYSCKYTHSIRVSITFQQHCC